MVAKYEPDDAPGWLLAKKENLERKLKDLESTQGMEDEEINFHDDYNPFAEAEDLEREFGGPSSSGHKRRRGKKRPSSKEGFGEDGWEDDWTPWNEEGEDDGEEEEEEENESSEDE